MLELSEWARTSPFPARPWLILGKGPTFARRHEFDLPSYNLISLNHAVMEQRVDVAHLVDVDVAVDCGDALIENCDWVLMPRHPHVAYSSSVARLEDFVPYVPALHELERQNRLVWYNASTGPVEGDSPVIALSNFSSEAALGIAGVLGATQVRSLGVDGGQGYSGAFAVMAARTLLRNGQPSFNAQFTELDRIAGSRCIDYRPLIPPYRIFIGVDPTQLVAAQVLANSLHEHASAPIRVDLLDERLAFLPKAEENQPRTPFSFNRFQIPSLTGYEGVALYLDSDMLVFGDVVELFRLPFNDHTVLCSRQLATPAEWADHPDFKPGRQFSVMLIDCERERWDLREIVAGLDEGDYSYEELMFDLAFVPTERIGEGIPPEWNHLERFDPDVTKLLHYTVVPTQPWRVPSNPLRELWLAAFERASAGGAVDLPRLREAVAAGDVAPDVLSRAAPPPRPGLGVGATPLDVELAAARDALFELRFPPLAEPRLPRRIARSLVRRLPWLPADGASDR